MMKPARSMRRGFQDLGGITMKTISRLMTGLLAISLFQAVPALAFQGGSLPPAKTQNGIPFVSGGIGEPEAQAMKAAAGKYSLMLTFAEKTTGDYLADVSVKIADNHGKTVLDTVSTGPIFLADLPAGKYTIEATVNGKTEDKTVNILAGRHADLVYYWSREVVS
jgi:hypothetical protein